MFQTLGTKGRTVIAAATAAAASSSSVACDKAAVKRTPVSKHFSKHELKFKIEEDWLAIDGEEVWPVADISNAEIEDAFQHAMQLVPHNDERKKLDIKLPPNGSSSDHDSEDEDVIVLKTPAMAMELAERTMLPDLSHDSQRAEMDSMMFKMVNACMHDANIQRAFIQNPEFSELLLKLKQGPQALPSASASSSSSSSAPLGPFEINEVPVGEPLTHMRTLEGHTLDGHRISHFARQFPQDHEPNYDEGLEDAFMQFSEKLVDGVGGLICKLADSCRKVWEQSASLAKHLNHQHPPSAQNKSNKSNTKSDPYDPDNCAKAGVAHKTKANEAEVFLRGVMAFAAVMFAIILFKRTGMRIGRM